MRILEKRTPKADYELLYTPHIARQDLWKTWGHLDFYGENMYSSMAIDEVQYQLKPMNCPFHIGIYNSRKEAIASFPFAGVSWARSIAMSAPVPCMV